eukprot:c48_g1_i1.p1 GENE.c48_g1_i1~~c48_g1_i1.p1  ORF type:complete len:296 (-),score=61.79 c48_g1_i1:40-927(-)
MGKKRTSKQKAPQNEPADEVTMDDEKPQDAMEDDHDDDNDSEQEGLGMVLDPSQAASDELVMVDFDFCDFRQSDFHSVKQFVQGYLDGQQFDVSGLSDLITNQVAVGTTIRVQDESMLGFITCLNYQQHASSKSMEQVTQYVLGHCPDQAIKSQFTAMLNDRSRPIGWIISERIVNLPPLISPPIIQALFDDIEWAKTNSGTSSSAFHFTRYFVMTRVLVENSNTKGSDGKKKRVKAQSFIRLEDSIFHEHASLSFAFNSARTAATSEQSMRLCMVIEATEISAILTKLRTFTPS